MTGKTHFACGEAVALLLLQPRTPVDLLIVTGAAAVGSVISDVDVTSATSHKDLTRILSISGGALLLTWALDTLFNLHLDRLLMRYTSLPQALACLVLVLAICAYGTTTPHRTLMHSISGALLLWWCLTLGLQPFAIPFLIAMLSHIALDLFNRKRIKLLWPLDWKFAFKLCKADGTVNHVLFGVGSVGMLAGLTLGLMRCFGVIAF